MSFRGTKLNVVKTVDDLIAHSYPDMKVEAKPKPAKSAKVKPAKAASVPPPPPPPPEPDPVIEVSVVETSSSEGLPLEVGDIVPSEDK